MYTYLATELGRQGFKLRFQSESVTMFAPGREDGLSEWNKVRGVCVRSEVEPGQENSFAGIGLIFDSVLKPYGGWLCGFVPMWGIHDANVLSIKFSVIWPHL